VRETVFHITLGIVLLGGLLCGTRVAIAQSTATEKSQAGATFDPLDDWKAAVLSGDKAAIKAFYISDSRSFAQTPQGKIADPGIEESDYWSQFSPKGLAGIVPKILEQATPQTGVTSLVLRIELNFQTKGESHKSIVSAAQVWMNDGGQWRIFVTQRGDVQASVTMRLPEPAIPDIRLYPEPADAHKDVDAALSAAQSDHKRVLVIFGGNWCYDCHVLDAAMRSDQLAALVAANYHVVHINVADGKANTDLGERFQVPFDKGFPALAVIDGSGQLITSQKQGEFESAEKIGMDDVSAFLNRWKPIFSDKPTR
jgi:ketosteroid isomerase-like protein